jgi:hypothetical protein
MASGGNLRHSNFREVPAAASWGKLVEPAKHDKPAGMGQICEVITG